MTAAVIWMPFAYRAKVGQPRRRADSAVLAGRLPVVPSEADGGAAPVAATVGDEVFRCHNGTWLRPVRLPSGDIARLDALVDYLAKPSRSAVNWQDYPLFNPAVGLPYLPFADEVRFEDALPAEEVVRSSERGVRHGFAAMAASALVLIGDVLWRSCPEPFLAVRAERSGVSGKLSIDVVLRPDSENDCAFFSLADIAGATSHAKFVAVEHNKEVPQAPEVSILLPSAVAFDPSRAMAERLWWILDAKRRRNWLNTKELAEDPAGPRMARILDAVDRFKPGADPFPVLAATAAFLQSEHALGRYGTFLRKGFLQILEPQLRRWATAYDGALSMSAEEEAAVAGLNI